MSVGRSHHPSPLSQIPPLSVNNPIYPPNSEDQSPINERVSSPSTLPRVNHVNVPANNKQSPPNIIIQALFWTLVVLFLISIGYYVNDNRAQAKEIEDILMNMEAIQNDKKEKSKDPQLQRPTNVKKLDKQKSDNAITEIQMFDRSINEERQYPINVTTHKQKKLKSYLFDQIPRRVWHYNAKNPSSSTLWTQKTLQQHKRMTLGIQYQFLTINPSNYGNYLPFQRFKIVNDLIEMIDERYKTRNEPQLIKYRELLIEQLISIELLIQNGGIFIQKDILLTEDIRWIDNIADNPYVNAKELLKKPIFIAFHSVDFSPSIQYHETLPIKIPAQRYMVRYPSIQSYFMACTKENQFLTSLRDHFHRLLREPSTIRQYIQDYDMNIPGIQHKISFYDSAFHVASQMTLRIKENDLSEGQVAIGQYQLATINQNFGPNKIKAYLTTDQPDKIFTHLSRLSRQQLQYEFGPIRYMLKLEPIQEIYVQLRQFVPYEKIIETSLIHETLFSPLEDASIKFEVVKTEVLGGQKWITLPNKLWIYCKQQIHKTNLFNQMWVKNTQKIAHQSNFQLIILNQKNLGQYISKQTIKLIDDATNKRHAKINVYSLTRIELISLAVLHKHGGVWVSQQTFLLDKLDWLQNINNEPYIWNKNGRTPKVVLTFQPHYGSPFQWQYNQFGIKKTWHLAYQVNFIAAIPRAQLINDWFNEIIIDLGTPGQDLFTRFYGCKMHKDRWTSMSYEMLSHDSIKCVLGTKKIQLSEEDNQMTPNEYYGLWAINGYAGYLKMRQYTSFLSRRTMENSFIWRYSFNQMQDLVGKVNHFTRIYSYSASNIQKLYTITKKEDIVKQFHQNSFLAKLLAKINDKIVVFNNEAILQSQHAKLQQQFRKEEEKMRLSHIPQLMWVYLGGQIDANDTFVKENLFQNVEHYAQLSKYEVRYFTRQNYGTWLKKSKQKIDNFIKIMAQKLKKQDNNLKDHYNNIIGQYISLSLLQQFGGIAINKKMVFHEDLSWVKSPQKIKFVNRGGNSEGKVLGFFESGYSSKRVINKNNSEEYVMYPSLESYFLASGKGTTFIKDFIAQFEETLISNDKCKEKMKQIGHQSGWLHGDDPYYEAFFITSQFVISKKQKELEGNQSKQNALDFYGLYSLNTHFYTSKLHNFIKDLQINKQNLYQYLAKTPLREIEKQIGPLRYFSIIPRFHDIKEYVSKSFSGQKGFEILQDSFLHKNLVLSTHKNGIIKYEQAKSKKESKEWSTLPQDVWIYIPKGLKYSELPIRLMFIQLNATLSQAGYNIHQINDQNLDKSIGQQQTMKRLKQVTSLNNSEMHAQSLIKLALLQKNGGIAISSNMLLTERPDWIRNISKLSSEFTFNKFGDHPKVLMFVDPLRHTSKWTYNQGSKIGHFIGWQDEFIAAEKDNELVKQWKSLYFEYLEADQKKQAQIFQGCQLKEKTRSKSNTKELSEDILQCVLNRKKKVQQTKKEKQEVCDYYGLWGISGYLGPFKLESQLSLDQIENDLNPLLWRWSEHQTQSLIGKIQFMAQLQANQLSLIQKLIEVNKLQQWGKKDSLLARTLYSSTVEKLKIMDEKVVIKE